MLFPTQAKTGLEWATRPAAVVAAESDEMTLPAVVKTR